MRHLSLWIPFGLAFFFGTVGTALFPEIRVWAFAPFLAILFHRVAFSKALWISFFCGLLLDCLSSQLRFGLFALSHVLVSFLLYREKRHFFEEKALALSLYTILISAFLSLFFMLFAYWSQEIEWSISLVFSDLVLMPFLDGIYAFFWFTCPLSLILYFKKYGLRHLIPKEDEP